MASLNTISLPDQVSVLLIYELIPEDLGVYFLEKPDPTLVTMLERLHGKYCGEEGISTEDEAILATLPETLKKHKIADRELSFPIHVQNCKVIILGGYM